VVMADNKPIGKDRIVGKRKPDLGSPMGMGKLPPQAIDLEEAVLGALMLEKDALTAVVDILKPESFYKEAHKVIFSSILDLFSDSQPIDLLTVTNQLRKKGQLEMAGGAFFITELTSKVSSASNIEYHARIITEQSMKREIISLSSEIQREALRIQLMFLSFWIKWSNRCLKFPKRTSGRIIPICVRF
jgi:replicative DNA helicase